MELDAKHFMIKSEPGVYLTINTDYMRAAGIDEIIFMPNDEIDEEHCEEVEEEEEEAEEEYDIYVEGEEVDLTQSSGIFRLEPEMEMNDIDEPYKDSNGELYYMCDNCAFVCVNRAALLRHTTKMHSENRQNGKTSSDNTYLASQTIDSHATDLINFNLKPFQCEICFKRLSTKANLMGHITTHSNEKPFGCHLCSKRFKQKRHLKYHQKIHRFDLIDSGIGDIKSNKRKSIDNIDIKIEPEEPIDDPVEVMQDQKDCFQCDQCPKAFALKRNLRRHQKIHQDEVPVQCEICQKPFQRMRYLNEHMKLHGERDQYQCQYCTKTFAYRRQCKRHEILNQCNSLF